MTNGKRGRPRKVDVIRQAAIGDVTYEIDLEKVLEMLDRPLASGQCVKDAEVFGANVIRVTVGFEGTDDT